MRVHVVSDVHGHVEALRSAGDGADALIVLGDLMNYLDYADPSQGILADLVGAGTGQLFADLRKEHRFAELRAAGASAMATLADPVAAVTAAARAQYAALFAAMPKPAYCIHGNVDIPALWPEFLSEGHRMLDADVVELDGWRFGFVGGWPRRTSGKPFVPFGADVSEAEYAAKVESLGEVDVLCSHVPPTVPELRYDTVSRAFEVASPALLAAIHRVRPRYALFGHVHQPLQARMRIGRTECVNVGHFRATGRPFVLSW